MPLTKQEKQAKAPWRLMKLRSCWWIALRWDPCDPVGDEVSDILGDFDSPAAAIYAIAKTQE